MDNVFFFTPTNGVISYNSTYHSVVLSNLGGKNMITPWDHFPIYEINLKIFETSFPKQ